MPQACADLEGGIGAWTPPPRKSQVIWVSIEISIWTAQEKVGPPCNCCPPLPRKSWILVSVIKPLEPLCKLESKKNKKEKTYNIVHAVLFESELDPPPPHPP